MTVALKRINVVVLFVTDVERSKTFYRDTLGMSVAFEDADSAYFELETAALLLLSIAGAQDLLTDEAVAAQPRGASSQLAAFVDDVDAVYRELVAQGVEFVREPVDRPWGMRTAHFKDPDGHIWEISKALS